MSMRRWPGQVIGAASVLIATACIGGEERPEQRVAGGDARRGAARIEALGCGGCHVIPGIRDARATVGPPLTDWAARTYIAGALPNTPDNLILWIRDPQSVEPGTAMPAMAMTSEEARDIAAYLYTVGDARPLGPPHLLPLRWLRGIGHWDRPKKRPDTGS